MNADYQRPAWADSDPLLSSYYEQRWGRPTFDEQRLFEALSLEVFQVGLSWLSILRKEAILRGAFAGFSPNVVADFDDEDIEKILRIDGMIRNRRKIEAVVRNASAVVGLRAGIGFPALVWSYARDPASAHDTALQSTSRESMALARRLHEEGFTMVGPTNTHAFMQATGMIDQRWSAPWRDGTWHELARESEVI